jgi:hypothetical protein
MWVTKVFGVSDSDFHQQSSGYGVILCAHTFMNMEMVADGSMFKCYCKPTLSKMVMGSVENSDVCNRNHKEGVYNHSNGAKDCRAITRQAEGRKFPISNVYNHTNFTQQSHTIPQPQVHHPNHNTLLTIFSAEISPGFPYNVA